jgi:GNAT superfamily N-acetyltransferase
MTQTTIELTTDAAREDLERLAQGLTEHALPVTKERGFVPLAAFARGPSGELRGGIAATLNWNWLQINLVWVDAELRRSGLGSALLTAIEQAGIERGCRHAHLDTFSYQARPFYEKHGYELFAELEEYPPGQRRYFLKKRLRG